MEERRGSFRFKLSGRCRWLYLGYLEFTYLVSPHYRLNVAPPSITIVDPVTKEDSSEAK